MSNRIAVVPGFLRFAHARSPRHHPPRRGTVRRSCMCSSYTTPTRRACCRSAVRLRLLEKSIEEAKIEGRVTVGAWSSGCRRRCAAGSGGGADQGHPFELDAQLRDADGGGENHLAGRRDAVPARRSRQLSGVELARVSGCRSRRRRLAVRASGRRAGPSRSRRPATSECDRPYAGEVKKNLSGPFVLPRATSSVDPARCENTVRASAPEARGEGIARVEKERRSSWTCGSSRAPGRPRERERLKNAVRGGEAARCLRDISESVEVQFQELFGSRRRNVDFELQDDHGGPRWGL